MSILLAQRGIDATVTIAHSRTKNLSDICRKADLVVAAIGRPEFVKSEWIKSGATVTVSYTHLTLPTIYSV